MKITIMYLILFRYLSEQKINKGKMNYLGENGPTGCNILNQVICRNKKISLKAEKWLLI